MKKMTKLTSLALALMLGLAAMLSACGTTPGDSKGPVQADSGQSQAGSEEEKPVTIKLVNLGSAAAGNQQVYDAVNEKLRADINATLEVQFLDWSDWQTKYPLLFAANENFDAIYTSNWAFYADQAKKGGFLELTEELIQAFAPNNAEAVSEAQWQQTRINGKIYMLPMTYKAINALVYLVRGDLRERYGMEEIETKDDLIAYWDKVLENDPDMLPIALGGASSTDDAGSWVLQTMLDVPDDRFCDTYALSTGRAYPLADVDMSDLTEARLVDGSAAELAVYRTMQSFQTKGYWSKNALNQQDASTAMYLNGKSATAVHAITTINNLYSTVMKDHPEWKPELVDIVSDRPVQANPATNNGVAINAKSKNPERTLMMLDRFGYDREYFDLITYGIKDIQWSSEDDTAITYLTVDESAAYTGLGMPFTTTLARVDTSSAPNYREFTDKHNANCFTPVNALVTFDRSSVVSECAAIDGIVAKYYPILYLGFAENIEDTMDEYRAELEAAGLKKMQDEYLRQLQAFLDGYGK